MKVSYPIPSPARVWRNGPYDPKTHYNRHKRHNVVHTVKCATEQMGQLSPELSDRYGIAEDARPRFRSFPRKTCRAWENRLKKEAKERGEEVEDDDPRFSVCLDDGKGDDAKDKSRGNKPQGNKPQGNTAGSSAAGIGIPIRRQTPPAQLKPTPTNGAAPATTAAPPPAGQPAAAPTVAPVPSAAAAGTAPAPSAPQPGDRR